MIPDNADNSHFDVVFIRSHFPDSRLEKEACSLQKHGYNVSLIVWDRGRDPHYKTDPSLNLVKYKRNVQPDSIIVTLFLPVWWAFIIFHLVKRKVDVIHAIDFDCFFPSLIFAKVTNTPIIYDIFDFYGDMIRFPVFPVFFRKMFSYLDRYLMQFSNQIIIVDDSRHVQLRNNLAIPVVTIVNSPSSNKNIVDTSIPPNKNFRVFYGGAITEDRCILEMCQIIKNLPDVQLTIMGPCSEKYRNRIQETVNGSTNIFLTFHWVSHDEIIQNTRNSDLLFALYDPDVFNNRYASPNKLFEAMMCGKPIIGSDMSSMADIIRNEGCGLVILYGSANAINQAIITLKNDPELCKRLGTNGMRAYERKYNWKIMENKLLNIYESIIAKL